MKVKRFLSLILTVATLIVAVIPCSAKGAAELPENMEIIFLDENLPEEIKERAIAFYAREAAGEADDGIEPCNILCDLLGHKLDSTQIRQVTHKYRATAPRCLEKMNTYTFCTRCDYESSSLSSGTYIYCCD